MSRKVTKTKNTLIVESTDFSKLLKKLPIEIRGKKLLKAVKAGGRIVAREMNKRAPVDLEDERRTKDGKRLNKTHTVKGIVFENGNALAVVGAAYPAGAHSHLLDAGHKVVVSRGPRKGQAPETGTARVEGKQYFTKSIAAVKHKVKAAVIKSLENDIKNASKK